MNERPDVIALFQRLISLVTRLFTEKIDETVGEGKRIARRAVFAFAGGLALTVGALLVAGAAVEALAPLVASRPLRLLLVAAPFSFAGAVTLLYGLARPAADHRDHHRDQRQHEQHVNPRADGVTAHEPEQPQHQQQHGQHPEHRSTS